MLLQGLHYLIRTYWEFEVLSSSEHITALSEILATVNTIDQECDAFRIYPTVHNADRRVLQKYTFSLPPHIDEPSALYYIHECILYWII
jgi:hypothetical protein